MKLVYWVLLAILIVIFGFKLHCRKICPKVLYTARFFNAEDCARLYLNHPFLSVHDTQTEVKRRTRREKKFATTRWQDHILHHLVRDNLVNLLLWILVCGRGIHFGKYHSVLVNTSPLFTVIFAYFFLRDKVTRMQVAGLVLGFLGAFLVASNGSFASLYGDWRGFILLFLSAASYAGSLIIYKRFLTGFEPITLNMLQLFFATIGLFVWILISNPNSLGLVDFNTTFLMTLLYTTIFGTVIANLIFMALVRQRGPTWFSMWLFLSPVSGVAISSLVIGETLLPVQIVGMLLVISSIYEINRATAKIQSKSIEPTHQK